MTNEEYYSYIRKYFKKWSTFYDLTEMFVPSVWKTAVNMVGAKLGDKILDIATGTGKQAFAFASMGYQVTGIDLSKDMLRIAIKRNKYKNLVFREADATSMPFNDNEFDVSCISFALHDMPLDIRGEVLRETVRVTKINGRIMIIDYGLPRGKIGKYLIYHFIKTYESICYPEFIKSNLNSLLEESGIKIIEERSVLAGGGRIFKAINLKNNLAS